MAALFERYFFLEPKCGRACKSAGARNAIRIGGNTPFFQCRYSGQILPAVRTTERRCGAVIHDLRIL